MREHILKKQVKICNRRPTYASNCYAYEQPDGMKVFEWRKYIGGHV
jgi:hypothetical protein